MSARLTAAQSARRDRILDATTRLLATGGSDAVQMRDVAAGADVALGTLYRYFPSKEYLLVSMMYEEVERLATRLGERPVAGASAAERVAGVLQRANRAFLRHPEISTAHVRALVSGNQDLAPVVAAITATMRGIIVGAIGGEVGERETAIADTLSDVWLAALVGWIAGVTPAAGVQSKLERTIALTLEG